MQKGIIIKCRCGSSKGVTMIEVIAVLVIVTIIAVVAISRMTASEETKRRAEADTLKAHLRYAQALAMNDISTNAAANVLWGINIQANNYALVRYVGGSSTAHTFMLPNEDDAIHTLPSSMTATPSTLVLFDEWGSPVNAAQNSLAAVAINIGGQTINITPQTGFIP